MLDTKKEIDGMMEHVKMHKQYIDHKMYSGLNFDLEELY